MSMETAMPRRPGARVRPRSRADVDGRPALRYPRGVRVLLCQCNTVFEHEVIACVRRGARTVEEVGDDCEAGTGCGSCRGAIKTILEEEAQKRRAGRDGGAPEALFQLPLFKTRKD
ncbi:(2Fe-2S)-binding protein [Nannocystis exedens]|nr:(2Fe-2S)-binding protein [Nannocystis exedens]